MTSKPFNDEDIILDDTSDLGEAVKTLITQIGDPARVLELHYWSQEPGLLECIRAILAMPMQARAALQAFLVAAEVPASVTAAGDSSGRLILTSPEAAKVMTAFFRGSHVVTSSPYQS